MFQTKNVQVMVRVTEEERDILLQAANLKGERLGTVAREVLVRWAKRILAT